MYEIPGFQISARLGTLAAQGHKYCFVKLTAGGLQPADTAGDVILGVLQREGIDTEAVPVMVSGVSMVEAGGAIAKGALVGSSTWGHAVTVTSGAYSGIALEAATRAGDIIPVLLCLNSYKAGT